MVAARVAISPQWWYIWPWGHGFGLQGGFQMCCSGTVEPRQHWREVWAKKIAQPPGLYQPWLPTVVLKDAFFLHPAPHFHFSLADSFNWVNHFRVSKNLSGDMGRKAFASWPLDGSQPDGKVRGKIMTKGFFFPKNRNVTLLSSTPSVFLQQAFCALVIIYFRIAYFASFFLHTQVGVSPPTAGHCWTLYSLPALRATIPGRNLPLIK